MEKLKRVIAVSVVGGFVVFGAFAVAGCSSKEASKPVAEENVAQTGSEPVSSEAEETKKQVLSLGEKGKNKFFEVVAEKVTAVSGPLSSSEATALLQKGEPGEEPETKGAPAQGNEYVLVTLKLKNIDTESHNVAPSYIKLENKDGKEYSEVSTGGYGGVYNMKLLEPGKEGSVTPVYEVPKGETDLTFTYQPWDDKELKFKVR